MNRAHQPRAVGFAGMISDIEVEASQCYYEPREPKAETIERCEAAWKILMDNRQYGITRYRLYATMRLTGAKCYNDFEVILENYGYLTWCDADNRLYPFRHPDGTMIEWQAPKGLFD